MSYHEQEQYDDDYSAHAEMLAQCEHEEMNDRHEYEERVIEAECRAPFCLDWAEGTAQELERQGWQLGQYSQFCGQHSRGNC